MIKRTADQRETIGAVVVRAEAAMESNCDTRAASVNVFLFFLCLYVLTLKGVSTGDDLLHYDLVQRVVASGRIDLPPGKYDPETRPGMAFFALAAQLAGSLFDAFQAALLLGLATVVWPYSTNYWTPRTREPAFACRFPTGTPRPCWRHQP